MYYRPPQVNRISKPQSLPEAVSGILEIQQLVEDLKNVKESFKTTLESKLEEIDKRISDTEQRLVQRLDTFIEKAEQYILEKAVQGEKGDEGPKGEKGDEGPTWADTNEQKIVKIVLSQIRLPQDGKDAIIDEDKIAKKVARLILPKIPIPKDGKDGKHAKLEDVVKEVLGHFEKGKVKLKSEHIDGYQNAETVMRNFVARGSLHGAGDTVKAGTNITLTTNSDGTKTIIASGGTSIETPTGTVDGVNTTFTVLNTPKYIVVDGITKFQTNHYTYIGGTITITDGAPPVQYIRSFY